MDKSEHNEMSRLKTIMSQLKTEESRTEFVRPYFPFVFREQGFEKANSLSVVGIL